MNNTINTTSTNNILTNATSLNRDQVSQLNLRQTVLIETNYKDKEVESKRVFLGNYNKRSHAYYDCFIAGGFLHRRGQHEYRLLKLFRALEELADFQQVEFLKLASYLPDPKPVVKPQEEAAAEANEGLSNDGTAPTEPEQLEEIGTSRVEEQPKKKGKGGKKNTK